MIFLWEMELEEAFYQRDNGNVFYVYKSEGTWIAESRTSSLINLSSNPDFPKNVGFKKIDPDDYFQKAQLAQLNVKFIESKQKQLEQLTEYGKPLIPQNMPILTNSKPVSPFTDPHFYDDYEPGNR